jgi:hypothetical protein
LDEESDESDLEKALARAGEELTDRLERGDFHRTGTPLPIPDWLDAPADE